MEGGMQRWMDGWSVLLTWDGSSPLPIVLCIFAHMQALQLRLCCTCYRRPDTWVIANTKPGRRRKSLIRLCLWSKRTWPNYLISDIPLKKCVNAAYYHSHTRNMYHYKRKRAKRSKAYLLLKHNADVKDRKRFKRQNNRDHHETHQHLTTERFKHLQIIWCVVDVLALDGVRESVAKWEEDKF